MKKYILVVIIIALSINVFAQNWCPQGAEWTYNFYSLSSSGYQKITFEKDTTLSGQQCKKLIGNLVIRHFTGVGSPLIGTDTILINPIFTYSQEDTVWVFNNKIFRPTYYFNAQQGDTLSYYNFMLPKNSSLNYCDTLISQVVDSTGIWIVNSDTLRFYVARHINFSSSFLYPDLTTVVEKFGAINNHFAPYFTCYTDEDEYGLRCYKEDIFNLYQSNPSIACDYMISVGINDLHNDENSINIFPNPFDGILQIKIENVPSGNTEIVITDLLGRTVAREKLQTELTNFNTHHWAKGMYVWSVIEDGIVVQSGKVAKE